MKGKYVGQPIKRREDPILLTGRGRYVDDIKLPGMVYAGFVRSSYAHGRITSINISEAAKHPDFVGVLMPEEAAPLPSWMKYRGLRDVPRFSLAKGKVRFVGEPVVAVVSRNRYSVDDIISLVEVDIEPLPAVVDAEKALQPGSPLLYEEWGDNIIMNYSFKAGDVEQAFASADLVIRRRYVNQRYAPTPIEGRGVVADFDRARGELTVWDSTQFPHVLQTYLSQALNYPEHLIRVIAPDVGGGFGPKSSVWPEELATIQLSMKLGRPVKWVETRSEHMLVCGHERQQVHYVEAAFRRDGKLLGIRDKVIADIGVYGAFWTETQPVMVTMAAIPGPYVFDAYQYEVFCMATNKAPYSPHRGFGRPVAAFVMERLMNDAAAQLGIDPADIRRRNIVPAEAMPFKNIHGIIYDSGDYPKALEEALKMADYHGWRAKQREALKSGRLIGVGLAMYVEYTTPSSERLDKGLGWEVGGYDSATVRVEPEGKVVVLTGTASQGQGHYTVYAQLAAEYLGARMEDVVVSEGDSKTCPYGFGAWASRSTVAVGGAIIKASTAILDKMKRIAAHLLEANPEDVEAEDSKLYVKDAPEKSLSFAEIAKIAWRQPTRLPPDMEPGLETTAHYEPKAFTTCSYAVHIPVVEVDPDTGNFKVLEYHIFDDSGRVLNPLTLYGQIHGALAHGVGGAVYEELVYDDNGQLLTSTFMDYLIPSAVEMFNVNIEHMETPSPQPGGFKGMGEGGAIAAPAALANAVQDALNRFGVVVDQTPLKPEYIKNLIAKHLR
ncbi:MAG: xanthine dehydrogenase family protein molybdopterin-binding subunit [Candidatus Caldarchaeum sp.]|nr:xanthine dehydrogenase family protein molybdopterin-binding subunit [Candidatus Caldarchaeum sp.]